jgi:hypothetical protein
MNKKAVSLTLVAILASVITLIVLLGLFPLIADAREGQAESLCKASVNIRAGTTTKVGPVELQTSPLLCKTLTSEIKESREKVSREIANKMAKCWEIFGEGTFEESVFDSLNIFGGGKGCFTCYVLPVEESRGFKEGVDNIPPGEFMDFLRMEKFPAGSERTFLNYFQTAGGPGNVQVYLGEEGIKPNGAYAVSYKAGKGDCTWCGFTAGSALTTVGLGVAAVGGAILFVIPEPTSSAVGAGIFAKAATVFTTTVLPKIGVGLVAKGATVAAAGTAVAGVSAVNIADTLSEAAIDTIILSDISHPEMNNIMRQSCNFVEDVQGRKLR